MVSDDHGRTLVLLSSLTLLLSSISLLAISFGHGATVPDVLGVLRALLLPLVTTPTGWSLLAGLVGLPIIILIANGVARWAVRRLDRKD